jgi:diguanylate cyclase (GGDEF)-like protein
MVPWLAARTWEDGPEIVPVLNDLLEEEIAALSQGEAAIPQLQAERDRLASEAEQTREQVVNLNASLQEARANASTLSDRVAGLQQERERLLRALESSKEEDLTQATLVNLTSDLARERQALKSVREELKHSRDRAEQLLAERLNTLEELQASRTESERLAASHAEQLRALEQAQAKAPPPESDNAAKRELQRQAFEDSVTGLPKFELGRRYLSQELENAAAGKGSIAVVVTDLDQLRSLNLHLGYEAGNQILTQLASRLKACLKPEDVAVRGLDDELWVVMAIPTKGPLGLKAVQQKASLVLAQFVESLKAPFELGGHKLLITVGSGFVVSQGQDSAEQIFERARLALRSSKREGRNGAAVYQPELERLKKKGTELLPQLRQALQENQFCLRFQPIYDLRSQQMWGVESLIRWNHPRRGLLLPAEFLDVASETGFMVPLGEWGMNETCRAARTIGLPTAFNVSAQELMQADFVRKFTRAMEAAQVRPDSLLVEISEADLAGDNDRLGSALKELRRWGVQVAIDDFNFDVLSLGSLRRWNVNYLKLGHQTTNSVDGEAGRKLARTTLMAAEELGCKVIAEAIATPRQLEILQELGCQMGQGEYLCAAIPPGELDEKRNFRAGPARP